MDKRMVGLTKLKQERMEKQHAYNLSLEWTGNTGRGTAGYAAFERSHSMMVVGKPTIKGSADPAFRGDPSNHNPEELLLSSIAACHMLWYLHLCAVEGIIVTSYTDNATGVMVVNADGSGQFILVTLRPTVSITDMQQAAKANELHQKANAMCFIARSLNFPVEHQPTCIAAG
jgi:organic hydroperoxide reductase OsmC/OhrA